MKNITIKLVLTVFTSLTLASCGSSSKYQTNAPSTKPIGNTKPTNTQQKPVNTENKHKKTEYIASLRGFSMDKDNYPSSQQDSRIKNLVMHYTVSNYEVSLIALTQRGVSSHYLIPDTDDNKIDLLVSEDRRAWHGGVSKWGNRDNINDTSVGIEIVNPGYKTVNGEMVFTPFSETQYKKIAALMKDIIDRHEILPINVIGHSDIAPSRKQDPGPMFPWKRLYDEHQIGAWYDEADKQEFLSQYPEELTARETQTLLRKLGYETPLSGAWDKPTMLTIRAFQWHFRPAVFDGQMDAESWAILKSLIKKYRS